MINFESCNVASGKSANDFTPNRSQSEMISFVANLFLKKHC